MLGNLIYDSSGKIKYVSKDLERRLDFAQGDLVGTQVRELFTEKRLPSLLKEGKVWGRIENKNSPLGPLEVNIHELESKDDSDNSLFCASIKLYKDSDFLTENIRQPKKPCDEGFAEIEFLFREVTRCVKLLDSTVSECASLQSMSDEACDLLGELIAFSKKPKELESVSSVNVKNLLDELFAFYGSYLKFHKVEFDCKVVEVDEDIELPRMRLFHCLIFLVAKALRAGVVRSIFLQARQTQIERLSYITFEIDCEVLDDVDFAGGTTVTGSSRLVRKRTFTTELVKSISGWFQLKQELGNSFQLALNVPLLSSSVTGIDKKVKVRSGKRILVVEDNQLNVDIISHFLKDYGYPFDVVENGKEAVDAYEDGKYDLILMDIMLPIMNGYEATRNIILKAKAGEAPPIIGVTAKVFRDDDDLCVDCGMQEIVHKPINFQMLKKTLDRILLGVVPNSESEKIESKPVENQASGDSNTQVDSVFDWNIAEDYLKRMQSEENSREDLVIRYLAEIRSCLDKIDTSMVGNVELLDIQRYAHSLKGNLGLVGANNMRDLARGLEMTASRNSEHFNPQHWLNLLRVSYDDLERSMQSLIS